MSFKLYEYVENMLTALPLDIEGITRTQATNHLFTVNDHTWKLSEESQNITSQSSYTYAMQDIDKTVRQR